MMEITDLLVPDSIVPSLKATCKKQALQELSRRGADATGLSDRRIFDVLLERERLGTTGVGSGIAIPHGKLSELNEVKGVFARLDEPIEFDAIDDEPVDLVFLLLAPEHASGDHLKALARISRLLREPEILQRLRDAADHKDILRVLTEPATPHAA